ncbi:uncharacterized protein LOC117102536 [Anneissia japonica]|uniref:uncharacterized protein LOC117102536 n=1 Tax=Anneissia japonica TaxID=1529436 RepID=UPI00142572D5|nr:uncharacterized protein LOC117102536 [Anneissia japonica]
MSMEILLAVKSTIGLGLFEFTVFLLVDSFVKSCLQSINARSHRCLIWVCESLVLLSLSLLIYTVHHVPYLLLILSFVTFFSAVFQYFDVLSSIQTFLHECYRRYNCCNVWNSSYYMETESVNSPSGMGSCSPQVRARPTIRRVKQSPSSIDHCISPIRNRIESPTNFTPNSIAQTSTPRSDQTLSVKSKLKSWVGINPYVNLPPGLPNRGNNMCFVNSVVQCLAHTSHLVKSLITEAEADFHTHTIETHFLKSFSDILEKCAVMPGSSDKSVVDNVPFCNAVSNLVPHLVSNPCHGPQQQQDAAEILLWLLSKTNDILSFKHNKRSGRQTRSNRTSLKSSDANNFKWRNKVINKLLESHCHKEMDVLLRIKEEKNLKLTKCETMHSLSCIDSVITVSDIAWVQYCRNHPTVITDLFAGQLAEVRQSSITNEVSFGTQAFHILPVPLVDPRKISGLVQLQDCITAMATLDELGGNGSQVSIPTFSQSRSDIMSSSTNSSIMGNSLFTDGQYQTILRFPPNCLILQLNRFYFDHDEKIVRKIHSPVNIVHKNLDLSPLAYDKKNGCYSSEYLYDLYAVCVHEGGGNTQYGHYLALCQAGDGKWYKFDDEHVTQINVNYECSSLSIREGAYLLFYKRQSDIK